MQYVSSKFAFVLLFKQFECSSATRLRLVLYNAEDLFHF